MMGELIYDDKGWGIDKETGEAKTYPEGWNQADAMYEVLKQIGGLKVAVDVLSDNVLGRQGNTDDESLKTRISDIEEILAGLTGTE